MNVRAYGCKPYRIVAVHGGPGALGGLAGLAGDIESMTGCGVIEPMQTRFSIDGLIKELKDQIEAFCSPPVFLIGHSWGAWLTGLTAGRYPDLVRKVVLIGCAPLDESFVSQIAQRRIKNMTPAERKEFASLVSLMESGSNDNDMDKKLERLGVLVDGSDFYDRIESEVEETVSINGMMYSQVWAEATKMRKSGALVSCFKGLKMPISIIHGSWDPHPYEGTTSPLKLAGLEFNEHILERCGHKPWKEKYARIEFYSILVRELSMV